MQNFRRSEHEPVLGEAKPMAKKTTAKPQAAPKPYRDFLRRYPTLGEAWELTAKASLAGPLDAREARLVKLGIAIGAQREGAVRASVRKALELGVTRAELDQVVALAAGTAGFPATVAVFAWVADELGRKRRG